MPSAVWVKWGRGGALLQLGFERYEGAAVVLCQAADFKDAGGVSSGRVDVQCGSGVHGVASLCGGRVRQISTAG